MRVIDGLERKKEENKKRYFMLSFPTITFKPLTFRSDKYLNISRLRIRERKVEGKVNFLII